MAKLPYIANATILINIPIGFPKSLNNVVASVFTPNGARASSSTPNNAKPKPPMMKNASSFGLAESLTFSFVMKLFALLPTNPAIQIRTPNSMVVKNTITIAIGLPESICDTIPPILDAPITPNLSASCVVTIFTIRLNTIPATAKATNSFSLS